VSGRIIRKRVTLRVQGESRKDAVEADPVFKILKIAIDKHGIRIGRALERR